MDDIQRGKMKAGRREEAIRKSLSTGAKTIGELTAQRHPRSSVYYVLNRLERNTEGRFIETERNNKKVKAFQLFSKKASSEEVMPLIEQISNADNPVMRLETAKDLHGLALKYPIFPKEAVAFLVGNWDDPRYGCNTRLEQVLLRTLRIITTYAQKNGLESVVEQVKPTEDRLLRIMLDSTNDPELRIDAWNMISIIDNQKIIDIAFELLERPEESGAIMGLAICEIESYASENSRDAKKRLYEILKKLDDEMEMQQRISSLLERIRHP